MRTGELTRAYHRGTRDAPVRSRGPISGRRAAGGHDPCAAGRRPDVALAAVVPAHQVVVAGRRRQNLQDHSASLRLANALGFDEDPVSSLRVHASPPSRVSRRVDMKRPIPRGHPPEPDVPAHGPGGHVRPPGLAPTNPAPAGGGVLARSPSPGALPDARPSPCPRDPHPSRRAAGRVRRRQAGRCAELGSLAPRSEATTASRV